MLPYPHRLVKNRDFQRVFRLGKSLFVPTLGLKILKTANQYSRIGIVVANRVSKKATQRNKIKRQIREIMRGKLSQMKAGYDLIIITRPAILNNSYQKIKRTIDDILEKCQLL